MYNCTWMLLPQQRQNRRYQLILWLSDVTSFLLGTMHMGIFED